VIEALPTARSATICILIGEGSGTGVIVSPDGLILTAAHVSGSVGKKVKVKMEDGSEHEAMTLGLVADNDAAMARMIGDGPWPHVEIDRDQSLRLGDWVFSLGHSGGFDEDRGSVVRLGRIVRMAHSTYQSDCLLIGGDSGGPLFDLRGRLVGIHSRVGQQLAVNMHVPMSAFLNDWDRMMESEFIGDGPFAQRPVKGNGYLGLATEAEEGGGLRVTRVGTDSPAAEAGVEQGDVILGINGESPATREELQELIKEMSAGDEVTLEIRRGDEEKTIQFELGER
jgi:serine protease Do